MNSLLAELQGEGPAGSDGPAELGKDGQLVLRSEAPLRRIATVDLRVPIEFKVRGGRKGIVLPPDANSAPDVDPR